ncbi:MAG: molybdopterin-dependent oxidoreductase [Nitrospirae bacterium]|nr:molybdopterin-dependent oxidoreductase [Nitrospirota bacterium]MBI3351677.1 molybdopterin-dependent oxidoreductase [Nitrospirota bacterium]
MEDQNNWKRRNFIKGAFLGVVALSLTGCDYFSRNKTFTKILSQAETLNRKLQKAIRPRAAMAKEFSETDLSPIFPVNGNSNPENSTYQRHLGEGFENWTLAINGLVENPLRFSLNEIKQFPSRVQITRHDCVEGWSAIGKWKGVKLGDLLDRVRLKPTARYVIFHCADSDEDDVVYYESIDLEDAFHPQTILAYELNDKPLPVANGAPIRLRVERQLGYKMAKFIMEIEVSDRLSHVGEGQGGYWEDQGYEWYAGI